MTGKQKREAAYRARAWTIGTLGSCICTYPIEIHEGPTGHERGCPAGTMLEERAARDASLPTLIDQAADEKPLRVNSIGTCELCGYLGPGPAHDCKPHDPFTSFAIRNKTLSGAMLRRLVNDARRLLPQQVADAIDVLATEIDRLNSRGSTRSGS